MFPEMVFGLLHNALLLIALAVIYLLVNEKQEDRDGLRVQLLSGLFVGVLCVAIMDSAVQFGGGIIFDTRSVLLSVAALFLGLVPALVSGMIAASFRFYEGGAGMATGILVIAVSIGSGLVWRRMRGSNLLSIKKLEFYLFGLVVHLLMLAALTTLPEDLVNKVLQVVSLPIILVYPVASLVLCLIMAEQLKRISMNRAFRQLSQAVQQSPASIMITDLSGRIEYVNPKFTEVTGYSAEEVMGQSAAILKVEGNDPETYRQLWKTIQAGETWKGELRNKTKSGEIFWELASISPIRDQSGRFQQFLAVKEDITGFKKLDESLRQTNSQLKQAIVDAKSLALRAEASSQAKSAFLANISHEIRTPLNGILGMLYLLRESSLDAKQAHFADTAKMSAETLLVLLNDVLDFSRLDASRLEIEEISFNLRELFEQLADVACPVAASKGLQFIADLPLRLPLEVQGDPNRLRQVINNLISNAIKFTSQGFVELRVTVQSQEMETVRIRVDIEDSGIGIPPEKEDLLFQPFSQVDSSNTRIYGGSGLGLAICRQIIEKMHGLIGYISGERGGTTFWFEINLPVVAWEQESPDLLSGQIVLVAEDEARWSKILCGWIEQCGGKALLVESAEQAEMCLREHSKGAISFTSLMINSHWTTSTGDSFCKQIENQTGGLDGTLVIEMQYWSSFSQIADNLSRKDHRLLMKPIRKQQFLEKLGLIVAEPPIAPVAEPELLPLPSISVADVLLADDHRVNRKLTEHLMHRMGLQVQCVENGAEAVHAVRQKQYDLILMDVQMPVMDGLEATRQIRGLGASGQMPIIALTALASPQDHLDCINSGMNGCLVKPIAPDSLMREIAKFLTESKKSSPEVG